MYIIISFLTGLTVGVLGSWFIWKNNKKTWENIEYKYDTVKGQYTKNKASSEEKK